MKEESWFPDSGYGRSGLFSANGKEANRLKEGNRFPEGDSRLNNGKIMISGGAYGEMSGER